MSFIPGPNMVFNPVRWWRYWIKMYSQWEFWAITIVTLTAYFTLKSLRFLPPSLMNDNNAKWLTTAIILLPMPYLIARKERRLKGKDDWFVRAMPYIISAFLVATTICFLLPMFADANTKHALSGLQMILQHPLVLCVPVLLLGSAAMMVRDYNKWREVAIFFVFGGVVGMWSASAAYAHLQPNPDPSFTWLYGAAFELGILAWFLSFIKQRPERLQKAKSKA